MGDQAFSETGIALTAGDIPDRPLKPAQMTAVSIFVEGIEMPKSNVNRGGTNIIFRFPYLRDQEPDELKRFRKIHIEKEPDTH